MNQNLSKTKLKKTMVISLTGLSRWNVERTAIDNINPIFDFTLSQTRPSNWISHYCLDCCFFWMKQGDRTQNTQLWQHIVTVWIQQANCHLILCFVLNDSRCSLFVVFFGNLWLVSEYSNGFMSSSRQT